MSRQVVVRLKGPDAALGRVAAADVARLLAGFERAIGRAAESIVGRRPGLTGRRPKPVEAATRLVLDRVEEGSVVAVLELPHTDQGEGLGLDDISLGDAALAETFDAIESGQAHSGLASALLQLADELDIGGRHDYVEISAPSGDSSSRVTRLDPRRRRQFRVLADQLEGERPDAVYGVLFEANFERFTAQLRTPAGRQVTVSFDDRLAPDIKEALRERAQLEGLVHFNEQTAEATSVDVRRVTRAEQQSLGLQDADFWLERTVEQLAEEQGGGTSDPSQLRDSDASDEEVDEFFKAIGL